MTDFDKIQTVIDEQKKNGEKTAYICQNTNKAKLQILWIQPSTQRMPSILKEMCKVQPDEPFSEVYRSPRGRVVHNIQQEPEQGEENHINKVNIYLINFNSKHQY